MEILKVISIAVGVLLLVAGAGNLLSGYNLQQAHEQYEQQTDPIECTAEGCYDTGPNPYPNGSGKILTGLVLTPVGAILTYKGTR